MNPASLDTLADQQARFRVEGSGPVGGRSLVPISTGARELLEESPAARDVLSGVLALIEHAAGGAEASAGVVLNGIALASSVEGHAANTYAAHLADDPELGRSPSGAQLAQLASDSSGDAPATKALVTSGWLNVGVDVAGALLAARGAPVGGATSVTHAALAVRVLRHEAQHLVDTSSPGLTPAGTHGFHEALAEAHSTHLEQLQDARGMLALDAAVPDEALRSSLTTRPYPQHERTLAQALKAAGIEPTSADAAALLARPASQIGVALAEGIARSEGTTVEQARADLSRAFGTDGRAH